MQRRWQCEGGVEEAFPPGTARRAALGRCQAPPLCCPLRAVGPASHDYRGAPMGTAGSCTQTLPARRPLSVMGRRAGRRRRGGQQPWMVHTRRQGLGPQCVCAPALRQASRSTWRSKGKRSPFLFFIIYDSLVSSLFCSPCLAG